MEVTLAQMLEARETRAARQTALIQQWKLPLVSFSMNIPGAVKDSPLIRRGFYEGCAALEQQLPPGAVKYRRIYEAVTGCEGVYVVDLEPLELKKHTTQIEDTHGLGRLFDMDVIDPELNKLDRELVGGGSRDCIVCGAPGRGCASRRTHDARQLQAATQQILQDHYARVDAEFIGKLAVQSLLEEVYTTPKPGLVDQRNNGSHRDMDLYTFLTSTAVLAPFFSRCAAIGMETAHAPGGETFRQLRKEGLLAEQRMFAATGGINTHKGAIFTLGCLCGAAGRLWQPHQSWQEEPLLKEVAMMTASAMAQDLRNAQDSSNGQRLYRSCGITGIRGEAARGYPSVGCIGLPAFRAALPAGRNRARIHALLQLIAQVEDTNMISRGGVTGAREAGSKVRALLEREYTEEDVIRLDDWFIDRNLSPGGCADLLAAICFVHQLTSLESCELRN